MAALPELLDELTVNFTKKYMDVFEENHNLLLDEFNTIHGLTPIAAQGTFFLSVGIDLTVFNEFKTDLEFLQAFYEEENVKLMHLSAFYGGLSGFRMLTCATQEVYRKFIPRLHAFC